MKKITFSKVEKEALNYLSKKDLQKVKAAFLFAQEIHKGKKRKSGEPYIQHSLEVTYYLTKLNLDAETLSAAFLHDVVEESNITVTDLEKKFGANVARLVDGVTKTGQVKFRDRSDYAHGIEAQVKNLRKMFLVMAKDIRVVLIRLYDRLHNMKTLSALPEEKQKRIAAETIEVYSPLAHRLGMGEIKGQLEDLAFPYIYPKEYQKLKKEVAGKLTAQEKYIEKVKRFLGEELAKETIKASIDGRAKHLYSLYKKLQKYDNDLSKIYDLVALRIIVSDISDCYKVLGIVHKNFKPLLGRIKDYISMPKPNGYRSLHTTVFCLDGEITEIQIRTKKMHEQAEFGIAAHWHYASSKESKVIPVDEAVWVKELSRWRMFPSKSESFLDPGKSKDFLDVLKIDIFSDRIFAFTPKGEIKELPEGATPIDFAYEVHSDVGDTCVGAKINGRLVQLDEKIANGDIVEITTRENSKPKEDWLKFAKTTKARSLIKNFLKFQRKKGLI